MKHLTQRSGRQHLVVLQGQVTIASRHRAKPLTGEVGHQDVGNLRLVFNDQDEGVVQGEKAVAIASVMHQFRQECGEPVHGLRDFGAGLTATARGSRPEPSSW